MQFSKSNPYVTAKTQKNLDKKGILKARATPEFLVKQKTYIQVLPHI